MIGKGRIRFLIFLPAIFLFLLFTDHINANPEEMSRIYLHPEQNHPVINENLYILEDKDKQLTIQDVMREPVWSNFKQNTEQIPNFGYTSSVYWTAFQIENGAHETKWHLEIAYPPLHEIDIFVFDHSQTLVEERHLGAKYPFYEREIFYPDYSFPFNIEKGEQLTFFLRFETEGSMQMPIYIWDQSGFVMKKQQDFLLQGIFFGIMAVMAFYNLFLFFSLRRKSYLYYVLYIFTAILVNLSLNGIAFQYLWPDSPWWNQRSIVFFMSIGAVSALLFTNSFLELRTRLLKTRIVLPILVAFNLINAIFVLFSYSLALNLMVIGYFGMIAFVLISAILCLKQGARQARFFLVGWFVFLIGILTSLLADSGIIPLTIFTKYIWQGSAIIEVVLLSLALADRINILRAEKRQADQEARKNQGLALENLRRSDQLKDEFLAMTSHELRTPLNGIIGIAETIRDGVAGEVTAEVRAHLTMIVQSGRRLANLINDILDYSKLKNNDLDIRKQPVNLQEITNLVLKMCEPLTRKKSIKLVNKIQHTIPKVMADKNRVTQILYNLVGNAIKYTDDGTIVITTEKEDDFVKVTVADTGIGIPSDQMDKIFAYFYQVAQDKTREIKGTGIGLSITKQLVELHGGYIDVKSKPGVGSEFCFTLPISQQKSILSEEVSATVAPIILGIEEIKLQMMPSTSDKREARILIADDDPVNLQVLMNQLHLAGYEVITATDGEEVIQLIKEEPISLLILDMMMPNMSGLEVCQRIRKHCTLLELPILMLTAKNQVQDRVAAFEFGANDYLAKPCEKQELLSRVKTLIQLNLMNQASLKMNSLLEEKVNDRTRQLQELNKSLEKMNDELIQMEQSRHLLLANIAHDLGTPVTLIQGYVQAVGEGLIPADESHYLGMVKDKVKLLDRLVKDLFDLSKHQIGQISIHKKAINLHTWITQICHKFGLEITQTGRQFFIGDLNYNMMNQYVCWIDIDRMDQVFSNLIWNAIKHTSSRSRITISAELDKQKEHVLIQIHDNGHGISEKALPFIFDRFYKEVNPMVESKVSGTGLGLAIVKEIVLGHEGQVWAESKVHEGSSFFILLPVVNNK